MPDSSTFSKSHPGLRLKSPSRYDWLVWLFTFGRPLHFRELMLRPAQLGSGEAVLDVSCGTGALALLAKEQVGPEGRVHGIDASEEMISYARKKAARTELAVAFDVAPAQQLPFDDASFDVVLNTLALHHLPKPSRYEALREIGRVLKPGGRAVIVDFGESNKPIHGLFGLLRHRHGSVPPDEISTAMRSAGFEISDAAPVGMKSLHFVVGRIPGAAEASIERPRIPPQAIQRTRSRPSFFPFVTFALVLVVLAHAAIAASVAEKIMHTIRSVEWNVEEWVASILIITLAAGHLVLAKTAWRKR